MDFTKIIEILLKTKNLFLAAPILFVVLLQIMGFDFSAHMDFSDPKIMIASFVTLFFSIMMVHNAISSKLNDVMKEVSGINDDETTAKLLKYLESMAADMENILDTLASLNDRVSGIPSPVIISQILSARTKMLMLNFLEICTDYLCTIADKVDYEDMERNKTKFDRAFTTELNKYMDHIFQLSKETLNKKIKPDVENILNNGVLKIKEEINKSARSEHKLYNIITITKDIESSLKDIYTNNMLLISIDNNQDD